MTNKNLKQGLFLHDKKSIELNRINEKAYSSIQRK